MKLIASDLDGTLLLNGASALSTETIGLLAAALRGGYCFCAASGRQYSSLRQLFAHLPGEHVYLCENGAIVYYKNTILSKSPIAPALCNELIGRITAEERCDILISGANTSYLMPKDMQFVRHIRDFVGNRITIVQNAAEIPEQIIKISAYCMDGAAACEARYAHFRQEGLTVAVAGEKWLDFTLANKGTALAAVSKALGISQEDIYAFGDNFNDIEMLRFAKHSYAMQSAAPAVKAAAAHECRTVDEVLRKLVSGVEW
jgi:Cof subfamily protein (haloacid dehalogenase superfamily)